MKSSLLTSASLYLLLLFIIQPYDGLFLRAQEIDINSIPYFAGDLLVNDEDWIEHDTLHRNDVNEAMGDSRPRPFRVVNDRNPGDADLGALRRRLIQLLKKSSSLPCDSAIDPAVCESYTPGKLVNATYFKNVLWSAYYKQLGAKIPDTLTPCYHRTQICDPAAASRQKEACSGFTRSRSGKSQTSNNGDLICFPTVFLAGVEKCGTTEISVILKSRENLDTGKLKEPHWWTRGEVDFEHYISNYDASTLARGSVMAIDTSASTFNGRGSRMPFLNKILLPHAFSFFLPQAKFIVLTRDPTARLWSGFHYFRKLLSKNMEEYRKISTPEHFHEAVVRQIERFQECVDTLYLGLCVYNITFQADAMKSVRISIGMYDYYLHEWLKFFPFSNFFLIRTERIAGNERPIYSDLFRFLNVNEPDEDDWKVLLNQPIANSNNAAHSRQMYNATLKLLTTFYDPFEHSFANRLSRLGAPDYALPLSPPPKGH